MPFFYTHMKTKQVQIGDLICEYEINDALFLCHSYKDWDRAVSAESVFIDNIRCEDEATSDWNRKLLVALYMYQPMLRHKTAV